jgi:5'-3' exonuclease
MDLYNRYGLHAMWWLNIRAIAGDSSDKLSGVPGVGPVGAVDYLRNKLPADSRKKKLIGEHQDLVSRNLSLMRLPHASLDNVRCKEWQDAKKPEARWVSFEKWCTNYGLQHVTSEQERKRWRRYFESCFGPKPLATGDRR